MKLFAELYLDEDLSVLVAELLGARGFDALTAHDAGMLRKDHSEQLAYAVSKERCMLTHNRVDYQQLHGEYLSTAQHHFGIIIATRRKPYELARRLAVLLNTLTADEIENQPFYI